MRESSYFTFPFLLVSLVGSEADVVEFIVAPPPSDVAPRTLPDELEVAVPPEGDVGVDVGAVVGVGIETGVVDAVVDRPPTDPGRAIWVTSLTSDHGARTPWFAAALRH